jgi:hypothetical protein
MKLETAAETWGLMGGHSRQHVVAVEVGNANVKAVLQKQINAWL